MKKQYRTNKSLLLISFVLVAISLFSFVASLLMPDWKDAGPWVAYQWGMAQIIAGIIGLIGVVVLSAAIKLDNIEKPINKTKCPTCGADILSSTDLFCSVCGASLNK